MPNRKLRLLLTLLVVSIFFLIPINHVNAALGSCSTTVSPKSINAGTSSALSFNVTDTDQDGNPVYWAKVTAPSSDFRITSADGVDISSVVVSPDGSSVEVHTPVLGQGQGVDFNVNVTAGNSAVTASSFTVQASSTADSSEAINCDGDTAVAIVATTQSNLSISNIRVSADDSSATISWSTGGSTTGLVDYGLTSSYGNQITDSTSTTSHSAHLTSLSSNTTYHFRVSSTDSDQNSTQSSDNSFTTGLPGAATVTTVTTTNTVSVVKEIKDTAPPTIKVLTDFTKVYKEAPEITGKATDIGGIGEVDYSLDDGKNWVHVTLDSLGAKSLNFAFTPEIHEDGDYNVKVKVIDSSGNQKVSEASTLIIDRLPPLAGGSLLSIGPQILTPDTSGNVVTVVGLTVKITFSAVGGPTSINLSVGDETISSTKNNESGLWSASIQFKNPGKYQIVAHEIDGANNKTDQILASVAAIDRGSVTLDGRSEQNTNFSVYFYNPDTLTFSLWDAKQYEQENPQSVSAGGYSLLLPPGTYYIKITSPFAQTIKSQIFTIDKSSPITTNFSLSLKRIIRIGSLRIPLPDFLQTSKSINVSIPSTEVATQSTLIGQVFPYFKLGEVDANDLRGKPVLISVLSMWHPQTVQELTVLNDVSSKKIVRTVVVMSQDSVNATDIFVKRAGLNLSVVADPDGVLVAPLGIKNIPIHYFLNRKGVIESIKTGILSTEEINDIVSNL